MGYPLGTRLAYPPPLGLDGPLPPHHIGGQSSRASTYYTVGSMPLVFMQEDFPVLKTFKIKSLPLTLRGNTMPPPPPRSQPTWLGRSVGGGGQLAHGPSWTKPPPNRMADACENITFPCITYVDVDLVVYLV